MAFGSLDDGSSAADPGPGHEPNNRIIRPTGLGRGTAELIAPGLFRRLTDRLSGHPGGRFSRSAFPDPRSAIGDPRSARQLGRPTHERAKERAARWALDRIRSPGAQKPMICRAFSARSVAGRPSRPQVRAPDARTDERTCGALGSGPDSVAGRPKPMVCRAFSARSVAGRPRPRASARSVAGRPRPRALRPRVRRFDRRVTPSPADARGGRCPGRRGRSGRRAQPLRAPDRG
jgi:hypothetical protein